MLRVGRGSSQDLRAWCARAARECEGPLWIDGAGQASTSWSGLRSLLAQLAARLPSDVVAAACTRHRPALSFASASVRAGLAAEEQGEREALSARTLSHLSHNIVIQRPLQDDWAALLVELCAAGRFTLLVPELHRLDESTLAVLMWLRLYPEPLPDAVIGCHNEPPPQFMDEQGIAWGHPPRDLAQAVARLRRGAAAGIIDVPVTRGPQDIPSGLAEDRVSAWLGEHDELRAWQALEQPPASGAAADALVAALRAAFAGFAFSSVLRLGLALERRGTALAPTDAADVHTMLALAAHNRQFHHGGNDALAHFIARHLEAALLAEARPAQRSALMYRLAVTRGRRQGRHAEAFEWTRRALERALAEEIEAPLAGYLEAWGLNIRAYLRMRTGDAAGAVRDCEAATERIQQAFADVPRLAGSLATLWRRELAVSQVVLHGNLTMLQALRREAGGSEH